MARNQFNSIPLRVPKRNMHNLSYTHKYTAEMGQLIPCYVQDVIPNDRFKISVANLIRFAPLVAPIMAEIDVYFHFFFLPDRLLWDGWEDFITGAHKGKILSEDELPQKYRMVFPSSLINQFTDPDNSSSVGPIFRQGSLLDYLGFQTWNTKTNFSSGSYAIDMMPVLAYQKVYDDYYRDENLYEPNNTLDYYTAKNGDQVVTQQTLSELDDLFTLRRRAWRKDYFTSALPWAQKGDDVLIPGGGSSSLSASSPTVKWSQSQYLLGGVNAVANGAVYAHGNPTENNGVPLSTSSSESVSSQNLSFEGNLPTANLLSALKIDSSSVGEGTIRELRRAYAAQAFLERRAVGGSRYVEQNLAFFGARSSDGRLQRAQFLGGYKAPVVVSQVLQTSESTQNSPQGQPSGNAVNAGSGFICDKTFEEYGFIIGIMSVMPRADYMQGIPKMYLKQDVFDYYWPQFARIGEQPIQNQELYFDPSKSTNEDTFGYTPRYAEYRFRNNQVSGDFKDSLSFWTLARNFDSAPPLNDQFIECNPRTDIWAVESSDFQHLWVETAFNVRALRPIPKYGESY
nr:major capsid protein [Rattus norvegicus microvirus]